MFDQAKLLKIAELDSFMVGQMNEEQANKFNLAAGKFIETFPAQEAKVKNALRDKNIAAVKNTMKAICEMLEAIYANQLTIKCLDRLNDIKEADYDDLQNHVIECLKLFSALSIDLQMVEFGVKITPVPKEPDMPIDEHAILAVDDVSFFLSQIKSMLKDTGYKLTCINSGSSTLNYIKKNRPGLFLLDIEMPSMDGYELADKIRAAGHNSPIIFLTGNASKSSVVKALQAGAVDFIVKPVSKDQLLERISKHIKPDPSLAIETEE